jgi:hypothetical protein
VSGRLRLLVAALALAFLAAHLRTLPRTLENTDSINFALGVESFDVGNHQPHPPGYPIFVALARASTGALGAAAPSWDRDRRAAVGLAVWSIAAGTLAAYVLTAFWTAVGLPPLAAFLAALLGVTAPLFWFTAGRPLSDTAGFVAGLAVQTTLIAGWRRWAGDPGAVARTWIAAAAAAGLLVGLRSQTIWQTGPFLTAAAVVLLKGRRARDAAWLVVAAAAGVLVWAVPLVIDTGGVGGYLAALTQQGTEDFEAVEMLWTRPTWPIFARAVASTFEAPWGTVATGDAMLILAVLGVVRLAWRDRRALVFVAAAFGPALAFHLAFQETILLRYALPFAVMVAGLAVAALAGAGVRIAAVAAVGLAIVNVVAAQPRLEAFARGAPAFLMLQDMLRARTAAAEPPIVQMHHQAWWTLRRPFVWYESVWGVPRPPFPGDREWRTVARHWLEGATQPIWFAADPVRTDLAMFDRRARALRGRYPMPPEVRELAGGARPESLDWWEIRRPFWMLGTGWAVTPEIGGMTTRDRVAPTERPAELFLRASPDPAHLVIGGRHLGPPGAPAMRLSVHDDARELDAWVVEARSREFVRWIDVPPAPPSGTPYRLLTVRASPADPGRPPAPVGLEHVDAAPANEFIYALTQGWNEPEGDPATGRLWRWTTDSSTLEVRGGSTDLMLTLSGESPLRYFDQPPRVTVHAGSVRLAEFTPASDFEERVALPAGALAASGGVVTIRTDRWFSPADRGESADRRRLGLRLFQVSVNPR